MKQFKMSASQNHKTDFSYQKSLFKRCAIKHLSQLIPININLECIRIYVCKLLSNRMLLVKCCIIAAQARLQTTDVFKKEKADIVLIFWSEYTFPLSHPGLYTIVISCSRFKDLAFLKITMLMRMILVVHY